MFSTFSTEDGPAAGERPMSFLRKMASGESFGSSSLRKRQCRQRVGQSDSVVDDDSESQDQASITAASFSEKLGSEVVSIYAGPEEKLYTVHKKLLCSATEVFDKMFNGGFKEAADNSAHFPEDDVDAWELLVQWLYQGRLTPLVLSPSRDKNEIAALEKRVKLYCLAETYGITQLMDSTIDTLAQIYKSRTRTPDLATFRYAYSNTLEQSPLRALMSRWFYHLLVTRDDRHPTRYGTDTMFGLAMEQPDLVHDLFDLMRGQMSTVPLGVMDPATVDLCTYHQHTLQDDPVCPNKKPMSPEAAKLLKLMVDTFPNSRKRFTVESLSRRLTLDKRATLALVQELTDLKKVIWTVSGTETLLECL